jgi:hypothetical protein
MPLEGAYGERRLEGITVVPLKREVAPPLAARHLAGHDARDERGRRAL